MFDFGIVALLVFYGLIVIKLSVRWIKSIKVKEPFLNDKTTRFIVCMAVLHVFALIIFLISTYIALIMHAGL